MNIEVPWVEAANSSYTPARIVFDASSWGIGAITAFMLFVWLLMAAALVRQRTLPRAVAVAILPGTALAAMLVMLGVCFQEQTRGADVERLGALRVPMTRIEPSGPARTVFEVDEHKAAPILRDALRRTYDAAAVDERVLSTAIRGTKTVQGGSSRGVQMSSGIDDVTMRVGDSVRTCDLVETARAKDASRVTLALVCSATEADRVAP